MTMPHTTLYTSSFKPFCHPPAFAPMNAKPLTPKVGLGVILEINGEILLNLRQGSHGPNQWGLIGGHMELGETFFNCAHRETLEEINVTIFGIHKVGFANNIFLNEGLHYITLFVKAQWDNSQIPTIMEPKKCLELKWFNPNKLPDNTFGSVKDLFNGGLWMGND